MNAVIAAKKSTTVRTFPLSLRMYRLGLKALATVAPGPADERAAQLFFTPRRNDRAQEPVVEGVQPRRFTVRFGSERLRGWCFGDGPTVLFAHGWEGYGGQFTPFLGALLERRRRAVLFDFPAHGASSGQQTTVLHMAEALRAVADVVGPLEGVVAHSLGATATGLAIARGMPVRKAVLLAPAAEPTIFVRRVAALLGLDAARTAGMHERVRDRLGGNWAALQLPALVREAKPELLVLHDPSDAEVPFEHGEWITNAWPHARLEPVEGVGHRRILRDDGVVARAVGFLAAPSP